MKYLNFQILVYQIIMIYNNINNHNNNKDQKIHNLIIYYKRFKNKLNKKYKYLVILN